MMKLHETMIGVPTGSKPRIVEMLNAQLAAITDLYSQAKFAHWNVRGPLFYAYHKLFDEVAAMVEPHVDVIAERITQLGGRAYGTIRMAASNSPLPEFPEGQGDEVFLARALAERFAGAGNNAREAVDDSAQLNDIATSDLLTSLVEDLDKALWFLEASFPRR